MAERNRQGGKTNRHTSRSKKSGIGGFLVFGIIVGVLVAGLYFVGLPMYRSRMEEKRRMEEEARRTPEPPRPTIPPTVPGDPTPPPVEPIAVTPPATPVTPEPPALTPAFQQLIDRAREEYTQGNFAAAANLIDEALRSAPPPPAERDRFSQFRDASRLFDETVRETKVGAETVATNLYLFTLAHGGDPLRAVVLNDTGREYTIRTNRGITMTLAKNEIREKRAITQEERNRQMRDEMLRQAQAAQSGHDFYRLGILALESNFPQDATRFFIRAAREDTGIAQTVLEERARILFSAAAWDRGRGLTAAADRKFAELLERYPNTRAAAMFRESKEEERREMELARKQQEEEQRRLQAMAQADREREAQRLTEEARAIRQTSGATAQTQPARRASPGVSPQVAEADEIMAIADEEIAEAANASGQKRNALYASALKKIDVAINLYSNHLAEKADPSVEQKRQDATMKRYWTRKLRTL